MKKIIIFILLLILLKSVLIFSQNNIRGINVTAKNKSGNFESIKLYDKIHAILIAIDNYPVESGFSNLKYAISDAEGLREVLQKEYFFDSIETLYDNKATKNNILNTLQNLNSKIFNSNDALLIFFAGHGLTKKIKGNDLGYIIPYDGSIDESKMFNNIDMGYIRESVSKNLNPKHIFYIFDSCYSGMLLETRSVNETPRRDIEYLKEITSEPTTIGLTAGTEKQVVLDGGPYGHSVFTGRLIEILKNTDDYLTAFELINKIKEKVYNDAKNQGKVQTPIGGRLYGNGDFVFIPNIITKQNLSNESLESAKKELIILYNQLEKANIEKDKEMEKVLEAKKKILEQKVIEQEQDKKRLQEEAEKRKKHEEEAKVNYNASEEELARIKLLINQKQKELSSEADTIWSMLDKAQNIKIQIENIDKDFENNRNNFVNRTNVYYDNLISSVVKSPQGEFEKKQEYATRIENERIKIENRRIKDIEDYNNKINLLKKDSLMDMQKSLTEITSNKFYNYLETDFKVEIGNYHADEEFFDIYISILNNNSKSNNKYREWFSYNIKWEIEINKAKSIGSGDYKKFLIKQLKSNIIEFNGKYINEPNLLIIIDPVSSNKLFEKTFHINSDYISYINEIKEYERIKKEFEEKKAKEKEEDRIRKEQERIANLKNQEQEDKITKIYKKILLLENKKENLLRSIRLRYIEYGSYHAHGWGWPFFGLGALFIIYGGIGWADLNHQTILNQDEYILKSKSNTILLSIGLSFISLGLIGGITGIILSAINYNKGNYIIQSIDKKIENLYKEKHKIKLLINFDYNLYNNNLFFSSSFKF